MSHFCSAHRIPRAGVDVVAGPSAALALIDLAMSEPMVDETVVLVLDEHHRGRSVVVVDGTHDADSVHAIVERLSEAVAASGTGGALIVASIRPHELVHLDDGDRWVEASDLADAVGVELVEWFVIGRWRGADIVRCPRELVGDPPRWTGS